MAKSPRLPQTPTTSPVTSAALFKQLVPTDAPDAAVVRPGLVVMEDGTDTMGPIVAIYDDVVIVRGQTGRTESVQRDQMRVPRRGSDFDRKAPSALAPLPSDHYRRCLWAVAQAFEAFGSGPEWYKGNSEAFGYHSDLEEQLFTVEESLASLDRYYLATVAEPRQATPKPLTAVVVTAARLEALADRMCNRRLGNVDPVHLQDAIAHLRKAVDALEAVEKGG